MTDPYTFRTAMVALRPMRDEAVADFVQDLHDAAYCLDAPEFLPAGSHEPAHRPTAAGLPTLAVRDL